MNNEMDRRVAEDAGISWPAARLSSAQRVGVVELVIITTEFS